MTGDAFNVNLCKYSKLDATKVTYASHVGYFVEDCDATPVPEASFIIVEATASIRMPQAPRDFADAQAAWNAFSSASDVGAPATLTGAKSTSTNVFWLWSVTSLSLMDNVYLGLAVCFPMVFFVLTVSTGNVLLALYSTATIAGIVTTVVGIGAGGMMGWDLGTTEAIASVIVIGFSVDYCVHLANAYHENDAKDREGRTRIALTTMGISVTAGSHHDHHRGGLPGTLHPHLLREVLVPHLLDHHQLVRLGRRVLRRPVHGRGAERRLRRHRVGRAEDPRVLLVRCQPQVKETAGANRIDIYFCEAHEWYASRER